MQWLVAEEFYSPGKGPHRPYIIALAALTYAKEGWYYRITRSSDSTWILRVQWGRVKSLSWSEAMLLELIEKVEELDYKTEFTNEQKAH